MPELNEWDSFYLIVGGAVGALIGLQFVVITLIASSPKRPMAEGAAAFSTPTVVRFGVVLLISLLVRTPWPSVTSVAIALGLVGLGGTVYSFVQLRRMATQDSYEPEISDWIYYAVTPLAAYLILFAAGCFGFAYIRAALFAVAVAVLLLLFSGIHNAWDAVTYHVFEVRGRRPRKGNKKGPP